MSKALSKQSVQELEALASLPDRDINLSDIPDTTAVDWQDAQRGRFYRPIKRQVTIRIDADVLAWLRQSGNGYQTRLNEILRQAMQHSKTV